MQTKLFFFLFCPLSFLLSWKHRVNKGCFVLPLIIITCFCFCSVNIISWFTWVSLFNNVFVFFCSVFYFVFNFQWFDMSVYAVFVLNDSLNEGDLVLHMCVSVCLCNLCVCVSRAISGVGFLRCFLVYYIFFNFLLCFIYGACLLYLVG